MRKDYKRRQCVMMIKYADDWTIDRTYRILLALMRIREKNIGKCLTNGCSCDRIKQTTVRNERNDSGRNAD